MHYTVLQAKIWMRAQLDTTILVHENRQTKSIMAFGQVKPIWKQMQELKWIISLLGFGDTSRLCTVYRKSTVWLKASSTSLPSLWFRKRPETTLNYELCKETCAKINHHLRLLFWKTDCGRQSWCMGFENWKKTSLGELYQKGLK